MSSRTQQRTRTEKPRRTLVGNRLVLAGALLYLCEFVGIIASHVHTMPGLPGASLAGVRTMYAGQLGATGFLVGWYSLVLPGRVLVVLGLRRAVRDSDPTGRAGGTLLDWAVALMAVGVAVEVVSAAVLAGAAGGVARGDAASAATLDLVAHYLQVAIAAPSGVASVVLGVAMWRSGAFPRVLAGLTLVLGLVQLLNGGLLSAPATASLQEGLTVLNLLGFVVLLWAGVLAFVRTPRRSVGTS